VAKVGVRPAIFWPNFTESAILQEESEMFKLISFRPPLS
jgi:hypothetical protein